MGNKDLNVQRGVDISLRNEDLARRVTTNIEFVVLNVFDETTYASPRIIFVGPPPDGTSSRPATEAEEKTITGIIDGLSRIKAGEVAPFAWQRLEPGEVTYDFIWFRSKNKRMNLAMDADLYDFIVERWKSAKFYPVKRPNGGYVFLVAPKGGNRWNKKYAAIVPGWDFDDRVEVPDV